MTVFAGNATGVQGMKTTIHFYRFDTDNPEDAAAYAKLRAELLATPGRGRRIFSGTPSNCMDAASNYSDHASELDGETIELETAHLFENQWNTAPIDGISDKGLRVFDWVETARISGAARMQGNNWAPLNIRRGHYLDISAEMRELRSGTLGCGYCGAQYPKKDAPKFCDRCLDSEYLKPEDLRLLRLRAISEDKPHATRAPLSDKERADLMQRYTEAQIYGNTERGKKRIAAERARIIAEYDSTIKNATVKRNGFLWLMDRGFNTANVIYYPHTGKFSFGWRKPLSAEFVQAFPFADFPFTYEIKAESD
jgi:hypothetical protein